MTVSELIKVLQQFDQKTEVTFLGVEDECLEICETPLDREFRPAKTGDESPSVIILTYIDGGY